jgi:hypothetical protein
MANGSRSDRARAFLIHTLASNAAAAATQEIKALIAPSVDNGPVAPGLRSLSSVHGMPGPALS